MPKKVLILVLILLLLFVPVASIYVGYADASLTSCGATVSSSTVTAGSSSELIFSISNTGGAGMLWIRITSPSSNFTLTSIDGPSNIGETSISDDGMSVTMILSGISDGETADYTVGIDVGSEAASSASFVVETSDTTNGDNSIACTGNLAVSSVLNSQLGVTISNLSLSISDSSVLFTWSTGSNSTGTVYYGSSTSYGNSVADNTSSTSHSVRISGLSSSTTYHYKIISSDGTNNDELTDTTFTTSASGETTTVTRTVTNTVREVYKDVILPSIKINTDIKKVNESAPLLELVATDESGIARIRYSVDSGINWQPINIEDKIGKKQIAASFTPNIKDDGDYILIIEVTDAAGNKTFTKDHKFTIDRLPPSVGPLTVMAGPQIVNVNSASKMDLLVDVEYKFILTASGGPSSINLVCGPNKYEFQKNIDSGVWSTMIKFGNETGECLPKITAIDGAGNIQEKEGKNIKVHNRGLLKNGTVTIYWYDNFENKFVVWDAAPYGQINPISTNATGGYGFLLPAGKYYVEAKSSGKRTTVSNIIDLKGAAIINDDWVLKPVWKFWQISEEKVINPKILGSNEWETTATDLPKVNLGNIEKGSLSTLELRGRVNIIGIIPSWHPLLNDYLKVFDDLNSGGISSYPVLIHENPAVAKYLNSRGGYKLGIYTDTDGELLNGLEINGFPTTLIVDKFGQIIKSKVGNITAEEIKLLY